MKTKTLMMTGLLTMISAAAFAQTPVAEVRHDNAQLRQDSQQIRQDNHQINHDQAVIAVKKGDVAAGKQQLQAERHDSKVLAHEEHQALKQGDLGAAKQLQQARRDQQHVIQAQKQEIKHDKKVIAKHAADKHEAQLARRDDKIDRHLDQAKRDHDASKI